MDELLWEEEVAEKEDSESDRLCRGRWAGGEYPEDDLLVPETRAHGVAYCSSTTAGRVFFCIGGGALTWSIRIKSKYPSFPRRRGWRASSLGREARVGGLVRAQSTQVAGSKASFPDPMGCFAFVLVGGRWRRGQKGGGDLK